MKQATATEAWRERLVSLLISPPAKPRGQGSLEEIGASVVVDMQHPYVDDSVRKISDTFRYAEAYWILSGDNRVETIAPFAPSIAHFSDDGRTFQGAYGPKVTEQLKYVVDTLTADPWSRQAVLSIWRENPRESKDIPCTLSLQFLLRDGYLHCIASMRSSDVWLGLPYDIFNFSAISQVIALDIPEVLTLGTLRINIGSSHLYTRNLEAARRVVASWGGLCSKDQDLPYSTVGKHETSADFLDWLEYWRDYNAE